MKRPLGMRLLSLFLALALCVQFLPEPALAYLAEQADGLILTGADGREIVIDESWEEKFPYGTFAFQNSELKIKEGREPGVLQVCRLGGTTGRAVTYPGRFLPVVCAGRRLGREGLRRCGSHLCGQRGGLRRL